MGDYVREQADLLVPSKDRDEVIRVILEDISLLDTARIAGMGITPDDLRRWKQGG
ncbi:MAG: hypothetical protein AB7F31_05960 [Parachlamydiales bacterium]